MHFLLLVVYINLLHDILIMLMHMYYLDLVHAAGIIGSWFATD